MAVAAATRMVVGAPPRVVTTTTVTGPGAGGAIEPGGRGARVGAGIAAVPQWVLVLGGIGVLAVVWYLTRTTKKKGGRAWKSRRPFG